MIPLPIGADSSNGNVEIRARGAGGVTNTVILPHWWSSAWVSPNRSAQVAGATRLAQHAGWLRNPGVADRTVAGRWPEHPEYQRYTGLGAANSTPHSEPHRHQSKVNYSKIFSRHTLKVGYEFLNNSHRGAGFQPQYGQDSYSGQYSARRRAANTVYNVADFLLERAVSIR